MVKNFAGIGKRILGGIIDIIVVSLIFLGAGYVIAYYFGETGFIEKVQGVGFHVEGPAVLIIPALIFLYFIILEATTGKTIGKYIVKTRVVNEAGEKISWGQSIGRNLMRFIDGMFAYLVGIIAILASKNNQRLGDMVSRTYVING